MPRPALLLGLDRGVSFMNRHAQDYLANHGALLLSRDHLNAYDRDVDAQLARAFDDIRDELQLAGGPPRRHVIRVASGNGAAGAPLSLTAFVPSDSMYAFGTQPQVLLLVHGPSAPTTPDLLLWEAAYNLTPSQSRVALEMLRGRSVKEAAVSQGIAPSTVKSHLQELFAKTGTTRQSQLVLALAGLQVV